MKRLAFLFGLIVIVILALPKSPEKKDRNSEYLQHQASDEDVWLGN
jgi:hypothetical protein